MSRDLVADQRAMMEAFGQTDDTIAQAILYHKLFVEESGELNVAMVGLLGTMWDDDEQGRIPEAMAEVIDGAIDTIVVALGLLFSFGIDPQKAWDEVYRSNMAKVYPDGTVHRREDGKIIKPPDWTPPDLLAVVMEMAA